MIASCPKCNTRYRVDPAKLGSEGARLRCTQCESVFRVRLPQEAAAPIPVTAPEPAVVAPQPTVAAPQPTAAASQPTAASSQSTPVAAVQPTLEQPPESPAGGVGTVLVADPDIEAGKLTAAAIESWGLRPLLVHDGVEAILAIQRNMPTVAIIDAALPKMFGFQVCEMVKRNESLQVVKIVLVGAIHHADRYRRPPSDIYGADAYLEHLDLPTGLVPLLEGFGLTVNLPAPDPVAVVPPPAEESIAPPPQPSVTPAPEPVAAPAPVAVAPQPTAAPPASVAVPAAGDPNAQERAKAERLARIVVSDIVLYHPEKFEAAVRAGNVEQALAADFAEGRALFNQRIDASVRDERDFLMDELKRVAAERSQQG